MTRLLLVDDNPHDRSLAIRVLRGSLPDLAVTEIAEAAALETALRTGQFDIAVIDYQLLWSDGLTVLRAIKAHHPDCPVVMFSDSATVEDAVSAMKEGLDDYVSKSRRHVARLPAVIQSVLERGRAYRAAREAHAEAEAALQRSHERFALAAQAVQATIYDWDLGRGSIIRTSGLVELIGYLPEQVPPEVVWWFAQIHPEDRAQVEAAIATALAQDELYSLEYRVQHRDGTHRWVWDRAVIVRAPDGAAVRVVGSTFNISIRKQLEEQLRHAQRMESVGRLAGGIAHDFNNLLTAILGYAGLGLDGLHPGEPFYTEFSEIYKAADRAAVITRQLLGYARRQPITLQPIDLNVLVHNVSPLISRVLGPVNALRLQLAPEPLVVRADPPQIEQVLMNLAVNARDAMPGGGEVTVSTGQVALDAAFVRAHPGTSEGPHAQLTLHDTGMGMDPFVLAHLFEPFFTTKEPDKGTGLGLAMCYGIIKQHGGTIWARSAVGAGTSFTMYLPLQSEEPVKHALEVVSALPAGGSETVLVVDDEPAIRAFMTRVLKTKGYQVLSAASGAEALALTLCLGTGALHLVVTDEMMPGLRGSALIPQLWRHHPRLRSLLISGYPLTLDDALHGKVQVLPKPFTSAALLAAVRASLDAPDPV